MARDRQLDETISKWLEAKAPVQVPDRVLRATFERTRKTKQQVGWRALLGRLSMPRFLPAVGSAAAIVVVAALALSFYVNQQGGIGALPSPTPSASPTAAALPSVEPSASPTAAALPSVEPSPSPALFARGNFFTPYQTVELAATGEGSSVAGRMTISEYPGEENWSFTVDLQCTRTWDDGVITIGGLITDSTLSGAPVGTWAAVSLKRGSPVRAHVAYQRGGATSAYASCMASLDAALSGNRSLLLQPIEGTVELGP